MSEKTTAEILAEIRNATNKTKTNETAVAPEQKPTGAKSNGAGLIKSAWKNWFYDGDGDTPSAPEPTLDNMYAEESAYPDLPKFEVDTENTDDLSAKPLTEIYTEAGVESAFSVNELEEMVNAPELKSQPLNFKQMAVPFALKQKSLTIDVPLTDAAQRDAALDGYALMLSKRASRGRKSNETRIAEINKELEEIFQLKQAEMEALREDSAIKENEYQTFMQIKAAEEKRMFDILTPFLEGKPNPVTVGNTPIDDEDSLGTNELGKVDVISGGKKVGSQG